MKHTNADPPQTEYSTQDEVESDGILGYSWTMRGRTELRLVA